MKEPEHAPTPNEVSTKRLETLTDSIFAIAMTLLVFGLSIPDGTSSTQLLNAGSEPFATTHSIGSIVSEL